MTLATSQSAALLPRLFSLRELPCDLSAREFLSRLPKILLLVVAALSFSSGILTRAQVAGDLDLSFGDGGSSTWTNFIEGKPQSPTGMAIQADGKIVVVGCIIKRESPAQANVVGSTLKGTGDAGDLMAFPNFGPADNDFGVARYNADGTLDLTFGASASEDSPQIRTGKVMTDFGGIDNAYGVAIQSDGKIIVVGVAHQSDPDSSIAMVRYNSDGSIDESFGVGGKVTDPTHNLQTMKAVAIQPDGKIVVAGTKIARYFGDGSLDIIFSLFDPLPIVQRLISAEAVIVQSDGKIVVAGSARAGAAPTDLNQSLALARYNPDGTLDGGFGSFGKTFTNFSSIYGGGYENSSPFDSAYALAIQPDGKLVVGGTATTGYNPPTQLYDLGPAPFYRNNDFAVLRYTGNGLLDISFGDGGKVLTDFFAYYFVPPLGLDVAQGDVVSSILIRADGKILAVGSAMAWTGESNHNTPTIAITRYNVDGSLDQRFGNQGRVLHTGVSGSVGAALQRDGKTVSAGGGFTVQRYLSDPSDIFQEALLKYVPILRFNSGENFFPIAVEGITDNPGNKLVAAGSLLAQTPTKGFIPLLSISFLNSLYPGGLPADASDQIFERDGKIEGDDDAYRADGQRLQSDARYADRIYGRVYYGKDRAGRDIAWLQYWFFYYYNDYRGAVFGAHPDQHEGDWEMIQIALDINAHPLSAVYAQHDDGSQCEWVGSEIEKSGLNQERPVVYVALGSHASYFHADRHKLYPLAYDYADGLVERSDPQLIIIRENSPNWINWPGHWGGTTKPSFPRPSLPFDADSPRGPKFQGDKWENPQAFAEGITFDCK